MARRKPITMRDLYDGVAAREPDRSFHLGVDLVHCYHPHDKNSSTAITFRFYHHATQTSLSDETIEGLAQKVLNFLDSPDAMPGKVQPNVPVVERFLKATQEVPHAAG